MSSIKITTALIHEGMQLTAEVLNVGQLPENIFLWEITDEGNLGEYQGICNFEELGSRKIWTEPVALLPAEPGFGRRFMRYKKGITVVYSEFEKISVILHMQKTAKILKEQIQTKNNSTTIIGI